MGNIHIKMKPKVTLQNSGKILEISDGMLLKLRILAFLDAFLSYFEVVFLKALGTSQHSPVFRCLCST